MARAECDPAPGDGSGLSLGGCRTARMERHPMTEDEHIFAVAACLREIRGSHTDPDGHREAEDADALLALLRHRHGLRLAAEGGASAEKRWRRASEPAGTYQFRRGLYGARA